MFPFRLAITELKKDNAFRKATQSKTIKSTIFGFMGQSCIFFFMMIVMYIGIIYISIVTIFLLDPAGLIFLPLSLLMLRFFVWVFKDAISKSKTNFLKSKNVYEKYLEVTKHIE